MGMSNDQFFALLRMIREAVNMENPESKVIAMIDAALAEKNDRSPCKE